MRSTLRQIAGGNYWYYKLVNQFGDVPFIDKEVTTPKLDFYSHTRSSILKMLTMIYDSSSSSDSSVKITTCQTYFS